MSKDEKKSDEVETPQEKRYSVSIKCIATEKQGIGNKEMIIVDATYPDTNYGVVVGIEQLMLGVLQKLGDAGIKRAIAGGYGPILEELGVPLPPLK